jgi:hypothetical protein
MLGAQVSARSVTASTFVRDVQTVAGGTGFATVQKSCTERSSAGSGFRIETIVHATLDDDRMILDLELDRARLDLSDRSEFLMRFHAPGRSRDQRNESVKDARTESRVPIVLPRQALAVQRLQISLRRGRDAILRIEDVGGGRGRMTVAHVDVHGAIEGGR